MPTRTTRTCTLLATLALTLGACQQRTVLSDAPKSLNLTQSHIAMGVLGVSETYTFQGELEMNGQPLVGAVPLEVRIEDGNENILNGSEASLTVVCDDQGRFTADFPLPLPPELVDDFTPLIILTLGEEGVELEPIPMNWAPRAWSANFAGTALTAVNAISATNATSAGFANNAASADALSDVEEVDLAPFYSTGWSDYGNSYQGARATRRGNMVFLEGLVENDGTPNVVILTLPESLRPAARHTAMSYGIDTFPGGGAGPVYRIDILDDGRVTLISSNYLEDWVSLQGIAFRVE